MQRKRKKLWPMLNKFFDTLSDIIIIFGVVLLLQQYVFSVGRVSGQSMDPTLADGQKLIVDRASYKVSDPKRFDIVAVKFPQEDAYWVKRVIGLPGERIEYVNNKLFIDGEVQEETFLGAHTTTDNFSTRTFFATTGGRIPEGQYLVLGDNRGNSKDGRMLGTLKKDDILGVARLSIYPLDRIGTLQFIVLGTREVL